MTEGWVTVQVRRDVKSTLEKIYAKDTKRPRNQKFTAYLDNMLQSFVEYYEKVERYGHFIELVDKNGNKIMLYDNILQKHITITIDGEQHKMYCDVHGKDHCQHIGYCFGHVELYKTLVDNGFHPPKKVA